MEVSQVNNSNDIFQRIPIKILYSDPYDNTLGESNWVVIILVIMLCGIIISGMILGTIHVKILLQILFSIYLSNLMKISNFCRKLIEGYSCHA